MGGRGGGKERKTYISLVSKFNQIHGQRFKSEMGFIIYVFPYTWCSAIHKVWLVLPVTDNNYLIYLKIFISCSIKVSIPGESQNSN